MVFPLRPWRGWRPLRNAWFGLLALLGLLFPVWSVDYCVMAPTAMIIASAIGPLMRLAAIRPSCRRCGLVIEAARN